MTRTEDIGSKLKNLIPGGAHTYSKGDDQWPQIAPQCLERGKGCYVWDADGRRYLDWSMGLTSICLGHAHEGINQAAIDAMALGQNFQRPSVMEAMAAERLLNFLEDRGDMIKFAKNGSTVTTAAVKLARAFTARDKVAVCAEHPFFSYDDWFIGTTRCPAGIPDYIKEYTTRFSFNDLASVEQMFKANPGSIACVILEPVKFEPPKPGFLQELYALCQQHGALLILDEMVTGFKWGKRGAGAYYGAKADMYTWGKGLANGHSVCALTGRRDVMELGGLDHSRPRVFLVSTTHGAEIPQLGALIHTLDIFDKDPGVFERNWALGANLRSQLNEVVATSGLSDTIEFQGEDCFFVAIIKKFGKHKANVARTYLLQELVRENQLFQGLFYPTAAHTESAIQETIHAWKLVLPRFKRFLAEGNRSELIGEATRPVFRAFNHCECLSAADCAKCHEKLEHV